MPPASPPSLEHRVVAEMRIAVDHAVAAERKPPGGEHRGADAVAHRERRRSCASSSLRALEPVEREQPPGRQLRPHRRHAHQIGAVEHRAIERDVLGLAPIVELLAHARADLLGDLAWCRSPGPCGGGSRTASRAAAGRLRPPTACRDTAACTASGLPSSERARCTWPSEAAAAGLCSNSANFSCQPAPSSAIMRRLTKAQPIGGASLCSFCSSSTYSGGSRSGMVAISCATFMIGPFSPPSAAARSAAFLPRSSAEAEQPARRRTSPRPPPTLVPTRA